MKIEQIRLVSARSKTAEYITLTLYFRKFLQGCQMKGADRSTSRLTRDRYVNAISFVKENR